MFRNFIKNPCNRYFFLWSAYQLQGTLYTKGSIIGQVLLLLILLLSVKETYKIMVQHSSNIYFRGLNAVVFMYIIYGVIAFITDGSTVEGIEGTSAPTISYLKSFLMSVLPIYVCYSYAIQGFLTRKILAYWMIPFLAIAITDYYELQRELLTEAMLRGSSAEEFTNNSGYILLSLLPGALLLKQKQVLQYVFMTICLVFILLAMKRGAIMIAAIATCFIILNNIKNASGGKKIVLLLIIAGGFIYMSHFVENLVLNSDYFNYRIQATLEGRTSGRDELYDFFVHHFVDDTGIINMLIGNGALSTLKIAGNYAHNDWLEILICNGILGIGIFFFFWTCFYRAIKSLKVSKESSFCLLLCFVICLLRTFFSMSISDMSIYITAVIGLSLAGGISENVFVEQIKQQ